MVPGSVRSRRFRRDCFRRPSLRMALYNYTNDRYVNYRVCDMIDSQAYMEYENFLAFQEKMCSVLEMIMIMFFVWVFFVVCIIVRDEFSTY